MLAVCRLGNLNSTELKYQNSQYNCVSLISLINSTFDVTEKRGSVLVLQVRVEVHCFVPANMHLEMQRSTFIISLAGGCRVSSHVHSLYTRL